MKLRILFVLAIGLSFTSCTAAQSAPCRSVKAVDDSAFLDQLDPHATADALKSQISTIQKDIQTARKEAPATLTADIENYETSINKIDQLLASVNYDATKVTGNPALTNQISQASQDAQGSAKNIDDYFNKSCK